MYTIYKITNKVNGRFYIGRTEHEENRKAQHWSKLYGGYHHNKELQEDYDKYGRDVFEYEQIIQTSQKCMEFFITFQYIGNPLLYNRSFGDAKVKDGHDKKSVFDIDTQTRYFSLSSAAKETGCNNGNISKCCKHKYGSTSDKEGIKHRFVYWEEVLKNPYLIREATDQEYLIYLLSLKEVQRWNEV